MGKDARIICIERRGNGGNAKRGRGGVGGHEGWHMEASWNKGNEIEEE